ncbi:MAG TPA: TIGR02996 domain-containing protein [Kofleriaceae bacterium]|jgi:uncharacterized protein (TIGR02996 family)
MARTQKAKPATPRGVKRVLERDGKRQVYALSDATLDVDGRSTTHDSPYDAATQLAELCRTRIGQGWRGSAKTAVAFARALDDIGLNLTTVVRALDDAELDVVYRDAMKRGGEISVYVLRERPTRELFRWMLGRFESYYEDDLTKAVKFLGKDPACAAWMAEELRGAKQLSARGAKFAARNAAKLAAGPKPAPVPPTKPVADEASLLAAIAAEPADDAARLVYADWLLDRGNGFGEFIQVSCKLEPLDFASAEYKELAGLAGALLRKHAKVWVEPIRPFIRTWSFERGMLGELTCDAKLFTQAAAAIAARAPRATLRLTGLKAKDVPALAACPLGAFGTIFLTSQRIDGAQMALLAKSPAIAGADAWWLDHNPLGDAGVVAIARSPHFASVRELSLEQMRDGLPFSAAALGELLASPHLGALRTLSATVSDVAGAFARCKVRLERLDLWTSAFDDAAAAALAAAPALSGLTSISIRASGTIPPLGKSAMAKLRKAFPALEPGHVDSQVLVELRARG